jgi:hypothetical protein
VGAQGQKAYHPSATEEILSDGSNSKKHEIVLAP